MGKEMEKYEHDIRTQFDAMADWAVITKEELACLLATTEGAISQMAFKNELPRTAFPTTRRAAWFVKDIKQWLEQVAASRTTDSSPEKMKSSRERLLGRPRSPS
jgi:predicted DNA-binding transcriptional regulator AlpA